MGSPQVVRWPGGGRIDVVALAAADPGCHPPGTHDTGPRGAH
ncbi:hypothetical protein ACFWWC_37095 [Streptomyces sp. NPDC058642]